MVEAGVRRVSWPEVVSQVVVVLITGVVAVLSARYGAKSSIGAAVGGAAPC